MIYREKFCNSLFKNFLNLFFETFRFDVPLYIMPLVRSIDILNMHSVKMHSLASAHRRNAKNMALRKYFERKFFFLSILLYMVAVMILSNFHYRVHHEIRLPSRRNRRLKKTDSHSSLQSRILNSQSSLHYVS